MLYTSYVEKLETLVNEKKLTEKEFKHFLDRGIQRISFNEKFKNLSHYFPNGIIIGASERYIEQMKIPYQETSFMVANTKPKGRSTYIYKTFGNGGGVVKLAGGIRPLGDNIFASLNRIMLGKRAIIVSADNFIENRDQIWNWHFFANNLESKHRSIFIELNDFAEKNHANKNPLHVIIARKRSTFDRLKIVDLYKKKKIKALKEENGIRVIFLTNNAGFQFASKYIKSDNDLIRYIVKSKDSGQIDIIECLKELRNKFGIKMMLNDGGRRMSDGFRMLQALGGERVTYEPYPGEKYLSKIVKPDSVFGITGMGIDGSELKNSFVAYSHEINDKKRKRIEKIKVHLYPLMNRFNNY